MRLDILGRIFLCLTPATEVLTPPFHVRICATF